MKRTMRVTFQKDFIMNADQDYRSIERMYETCYGMRVTNVEEVKEDSGPITSFEPSSNPR